MKNSTYISRACFAAGAVAVLLADRLPQYHWVLLVVLLVATVTAASVHFYIRFSAQQHGEPPAYPKTVEPAKPHYSGGEQIVGRDERLGLQGVVVPCEQARYRLPHKPVIYVSSVYFRDRAKIRMSSGRALTVKMHSYSVSPVEQDFNLDLVVALARRFSPQRTEYEVTWYPHSATFRIRPVMLLSPKQTAEIDMSTRNLVAAGFI